LPPFATPFALFDQVSLGRHTGQPFVPVCYWPSRRLRHLGPERLSLLGCRIDAAVHQLWQSDNYQSNLVSRDEIRQRLEILRLRAPREHAQWLSDRPGWITEREAEPDGARIDRQDPQGLELPETSWTLSVIRELKSGSHGRP